MSDSMLRKLIPVITSMSIFTLLCGGCPIDPAGLDPKTPAPPAGFYLVVEENSQITYYGLPSQRGDTVEEAVVEGDAEWFVGNGLYEVDAEGSWRLRARGSDADLDEMVMLHDPRPAK